MRVLLIFAVLCGLAPLAHAADEFGARFGNAAPSALEDSAPESNIAQTLQNISPAAGGDGPQTASESYGPPEYLESTPALNAPQTTKPQNPKETTPPHIAP